MFIDIHTYCCNSFLKKVLNLEESRVEYMGGFGGRKGGKNVVMNYNLNLKKEGGRYAWAFFCKQNNTLSRVVGARPERRAEWVELDQRGERSGWG